MSDTAARLQPISRTEIAMRVQGIIADLFCVPCSWFSEQSFVKNIGVRMDGTEAPRSATWIAVAVDRIERSFNIRLDDAHTLPNIFAQTITVGELIALVEGALSEEARQKGIA